MKQPKLDDLLMITCTAFQASEINRWRFSAHGPAGSGKLFRLIKKCWFVVYPEVWQKSKYTTIYIYTNDRNQLNPKNIIWTSLNKKDPMCWTFHLTSSQPSNCSSGVPTQVDQTKGFDVCLKQLNGNTAKSWVYSLEIRSHKLRLLPFWHGFPDDWTPAEMVGYCLEFAGSGSEYFRTILDTRL